MINHNCSTVLFSKIRGKIIKDVLLCSAEGNQIMTRTER